ncbi:hypothetical protein XFF6166_630004 [Xanthomonas citri pv. fuscans]|nr:hypothetical protein XFF6166_630004 [Xanthomonas citri pv. fuscans]SOO03001.1 hypothetical protein XFF6960_760002 [Xanthomonas citri pv. fuscans]
MLAKLRVQVLKNRACRVDDQACLIAFKQLIVRVGQACIVSSWIEAIHDIAQGREHFGHCVWLWAKIIEGGVGLSQQLEQISDRCVGRNLDALGSAYRFEVSVHRGVHAIYSVRRATRAHQCGRICQGALQ